jgi:hypothetical protein
MTDMQEGPAAPGGTRDSALRPAASDLHPADPTDDLSGNTPGGSTGTTTAEDAGWPTEDAADGEALGTDLPDASGPDAPWPGDTVPGDGTVDPGRTAPEADALRTAEYGRESEEAAAVTSDSAPRPTETPVE